MRENRTAENPTEQVWKEEKEEKMKGRVCKKEARRRMRVCETTQEKRTRRRKRGEPRARSSVTPLYSKDSMLSIRRKVCEKTSYEALEWFPERMLIGKMN